MSWQPQLMRFVIIIVTMIGSLGCTSAPPSDIDELQSAVHQCGMDHRIKFQKVDKGQYTVAWVDPHADFTRFQCVLRRLDAQGIRVGFIGSEQVHP